MHLDFPAKQQFEKQLNVGSVLTIEQQSNYIA